MRILVVEDDKDLNRQLSEALQQNGYVVDKAFDGEEGHFLGDTEPYDAIVLDLGLPVLDGVSVLSKWRSQKVIIADTVIANRNKPYAICADMNT